MSIKSKLTLIPLAIASIVLAVFFGGGSDDNFSFLETQVMADSVGEGGGVNTGSSAEGAAEGSGGGSAGCCTA